MSYDELLAAETAREKKIRVKDIRTRIDNVTRLRHVADVSHDRPLPFPVLFKCLKLWYLESFLLFHM
jgi:hypothetical protein